MTSSIVALDPATGELGVAVQTRWFARRGAAVTGLLCAILLGGCAPTPPLETILPGPRQTATTTPGIVPTVAVSTAPGATASAEPTPAASTPTGSSACQLSDLKASHGLVDEDAGSRFTDLVLVAAGACSVGATPALRLRDAAGAVLAEAAPAGAGQLALAGSVAYTSQVRLANWCGPDPTFPLTLEIVLGGEELAVTGDSFPDEGNLPPCNGGGAATLEASAWAATP